MNNFGGTISAAHTWFGGDSLPKPKRYIQAETIPLHGERTRPRVRFGAPRVELSRRLVAQLTSMAIAVLRLADEASASTREGAYAPQKERNRSG